MANPQLLDITRQINALPRYDRLRLIGQIVRSLLTATRTNKLDRGSPASALAELQQICVEENYTLETPARVDRPNPFNEEGYADSM